MFDLFLFFEFAYTNHGVFIHEEETIYDGSM